MQKKKCLTCTTYVSQQTWKSELENQHCVTCLGVMASIQSIKEIVKTCKNKEIEITWKIK